MYTYLYEAIVGFGYNLNWVLALLLVLLVPIAAFYAGLLLTALNKGERKLSLASILPLPAMALLEGVLYAFATTGGAATSQQSVRLVLFVAEAVCAVFELVHAVRHGYERPALFVVGALILGLAPFGVMAILGGLLFGFQFVGAVILLAVFAYVMSHTDVFPGL